VCDIDQRAARNVAAKFNIPHTYTDLSELLSKEELDIVSICTSPQTHVHMAIESMAYGCHVLLEKPMALNVDDCDKLIYYSRKYGVKLCLAHNQRFYPVYLRAQELLKKGKIGSLTNMRVLSAVPSGQYIDQKNHWINKLPGGAVEECGPHPVYLSLPFLKGVKNVVVFGRKTTSHPWVSLDNYDILLEGQEVNCQIINSHGGDYTAFEIDLIGNRGLLKLDLQSMSLTFSRGQMLEPMSSNIRSSGMLLASYSLNIAGQIVKNVMSNALAAFSGKTFVSHYILIQKFVDNIVNNTEVPVTPEEGRETIRVMNEIVRQLTRERTLEPSAGLSEMHHSIIAKDPTSEL
jgi:predicted dehydrogenase